MVAKLLITKIFAFTVSNANDRRPGGHVARKQAPGICNVAMNNNTEEFEEASLVASKLAGTSRNKPPNEKRAIQRNKTEL